MARASCVYVVWNVALNEPVAGFTVKHELVSWLTTREHTLGITVWRLSDGNHYGINKHGVDITDDVCVS